MINTSIWFRFTHVKKPSLFCYFCIKSSVHYSYARKCLCSLILVAYFHLKMSIEMSLFVFARFCLRFLYIVIRECNFVHKFANPIILCSARRKHQTQHKRPECRLSVCYYVCVNIKTGAHDVKV